MSETAAPPGPPGRELAAYVPDDMEWRQLNYGQGEGQVEIDGREWGLYWTAAGNLSVVLHQGEIALADAVEFIRKVARHVAPGVEDVQMFLVAADEP